MLDEVVLIASDERVAQRLRIGLHANSKCLGGFAGAVAEIGLRQTLDLVCVTILHPTPHAIHGKQFSNFDA